MLESDLFLQVTFLVHTATSTVRDARLIIVRWEKCRDRSLDAFLYLTVVASRFFLHFLVFLDRKHIAILTGEGSMRCGFPAMIFYHTLPCHAIQCRVMGEINYLAVDRYLHHTGVTVS
jgi:hypothetical protein